MKPIIGITSSLIESFVANDQNYSVSLVKAGALPIVIPPLRDLREVQSVLSRIDGLILSGGQDISPLLYQEDPHPACGEFSDRRDRFELALYQEARRMGLPILAICRGFQLVNVAHGGSLFQDIEAQRPESMVHTKPEASVAHHRVRFVEGSIINQFLGSEIQVNSLHHQAINRLGEGLSATGQASDGMIEVFEADNLLAVQFHPERLHEQEPFLELFRELVRRSR